MLFHRKTLLPLMVALMTMLLSGCGEKTVVAPASTKLEQAQDCLRCHAVQSPVTGKLIEDEWKLSAHNTKNGAACADCHVFDPSHKSGTICKDCHSEYGHAYRTPNPDTLGSCGACHTSKAGFGLSTFNGKTRNTLKSHFSNISSSYVSSRNVKNCRNCHNPHDTSSQIDILRAWARSGHGRTNAAPWNKYDFKTALFNDPNAPCNRCHTTTGFIKYITTGDSKPWGSASDPTKEMLGCNACHTSYAYTVRQTGPVTATYTNAAESYPDSGYANLCLNCHVGRESGNSIKNSTADFSNTSFINSHYLTAGGTVFGKSGYQFGARTYDSHIKGDGTSNDFIHDRLGRSDVGTYGESIGAPPTTLTEFRDAARYINANALDKAGPCVVCHLTSRLIGKNGSHTFKPFTVYSSAAKLKNTALNPVCVNCHTARGDGSNAKGTWFEAEWKRNINAGLDILKQMLNSKGLYFYNSNPYFFKDANTDGVFCTPELVVTGSCATSEAISANKVTNWTLAYPATPKDTMGAAFNYNLLAHDPGAIAHNRLYVRRLLYDAIDYMDDGALNFSVGTTIKALPASDTRDFSAILLISTISHNGLEGAARRPDYAVWVPAPGDSNERY